MRKPTFECSFCGKRTYKQYLPEKWALVKETDLSKDMLISIVSITTGCDRHNELATLKDPFTFF